MAKIRLSYIPTDTDTPKSWIIDPEDMDNLESEDLELVGGTTWDSYGQWFFLLGRGNMRAMRALLWILLRREQPDLDFNEVRFRTSQFGVENVMDEPMGKDEPDDTATSSQSATPDSPQDSESSTDGQSQSSTQPASG